MHAEVEGRRDEIAGICRRHGVSRLEVFGSAARGVDFDPDPSDADFLVRFRPDYEVDPLGQFFDLVDAQSGALGRPVDLVEEGAVTNPYLLASINQGNWSMRRDPRVLLTEVEQASEEIRQFIKGMDFAEYVRDVRPRRRLPSTMPSSATR